MTATQEKTPVPSATVTLVRDGGHGLEVLMMERNLQSVFVPGSYVYPGGAVDAQDAAPEASEICAGLDDARRVRCSRLRPADSPTGSRRFASRSRKPGCCSPTIRAAVSSS